MDWKYNNPKFEYEEKFQDLSWPWSGHKFFAYDLISNLRPEKVVELGTHYGTSLWSFSQAIKDNGLNTEIFSIDTWKGEKHAGFYGEEVFETVNEIKNKYYNKINLKLKRQTFDEALKDFKDNSIDILHIDGLHTYEAVKHDFENWVSKVKDGGIILFHDIMVSRDDFGVYKIWEELKNNHKTIEFQFSYGLGVLVKGDNLILDNKKELINHYSHFVAGFEKEEIDRREQLIKDKEKASGFMLEKIKEKESVIQQKNIEIEDKNNLIQQIQEGIKDKESQIEALKNSTSWKITKPIRFIKDKTLKIITLFTFLIKKGLVVFKEEGSIIFLKKAYKYLFSRFADLIFKIHPMVDGGQGIIENNIYSISRDGFKTKDVLNQIDDYFINNNKETLLLISHDASASGVPILSSDIIRVLDKNFNQNVITIIIKGGPIEKDFSSGGLLINLNQKSFNDLKKIKEIESIFSSIKKHGVKKCICNSVVSGILVPFLEKNQFDYINLIHEQASTIKKYHFYDALNNIINKSKKVVFSSRFVKNELTKTFNQKLMKSMVYPQGLYFKNKLGTNKELARYLLRKKLNIPENANIILSCGHADIRKGFDLFYDVVENVHEFNNKREIHFVWLGSRDENLAKKLKNKSLFKKFSRFIHLCDFEADPSVYFAGADVFLLTSREDPLPTVVLMAMDCGVPVIVFDGAGGSSEFLKSGAGLIVPYLDTDSMSKGIIRLLDNKKLCESISARAKEVIDNKFDFNKYVEFLLNLFDDKTNPSRDKKTQVDLRVSVVVPNYNYERFLDERLYSIVCQTHKPFEIIFLDDNSNDNSVQLAEMFLSKTDIPYKIIKNNINMGCFKQWARGVKEAKGDLIWIAEADDSCSPKLLESLVNKFDDPEVGLAYAQSQKMNEIGDKKEVCFPYEINKEINDRWRKDYINNGQEEICEYLFEKNIIVNASAVLMRRELLLKLGDKIGGGFNMAGDWYTYIQILKDSKIAFSSEVLNYHRYHDRTIVSRSGNVSEEKAKKLISEILGMHNFILSNFLIGPKYSRLAYEHLKLVCRSHLMKDPEFFSEFADKLSVYKINNTHLNKKILFFSTNDYWGGSEVACATLAQSFSKEGWGVALVMNKYASRPEIIKNIVADRSIDFYERGANDYCSSNETSNFVIKQKPDIIFISQGHVFESIELMKWCKEHNIKYVNFIPLVTEHHLSFIENTSSIKENLDLLNQSKKIFIDNNNSIQIMRKMVGDSLDNFQVIYNGFDVNYNQKFTWNEPLEDKYNLAFVGRLEEVHKGLDILLEVLSLKKWKNRPLKIMIYGSGPYDEKIKEKIIKNNMNNIVLCGYSDNLEVTFSQVQGVIFSSRMEGTPISLIDALLCNRMAIVTPVGGMPEIIKDGLNGFVAESVTIDALDKCLEIAWQKRKEWKKMGKAAGLMIRNIIPELPHSKTIEIIKKIL